MRFRGVKVILRDGLEVTDQVRVDMFHAWQDLQLLHATQPGLQYKYMIGGKKSWKVSSLNGVDRIELLGYPSEKEQVQPLIKVMQIKEVFYLPAFEAYDSEENHIGYVIARGGGFKPPYEYIPKNEQDETDLFSWGQWLENFSERPFNDLSEYLKLNFIHEDTGLSSRIIRRKLEEVPPSGTRNRLFHGVAEAIQSSDLIMGAMTGDCEQICIIEPPTNYDNPDILLSSASQNFTLIENSHFVRKFTYSIEGETGAEPPEKDTSSWWRWLYGTRSLDYFEYDVWDKTYDFNANIASYTGYATGVLSTLHNKKIYTLMTCEEMKAHVPTGCSLAASSHASWDWTYITDEREYSCIGFMFYSQPSVDFAPPTTVSDPNPAWSLYATTFSATHSRYIKTEKRKYKSRHSSVEDENHFGIIYQNKETRIDLAFAKSDSALIEWPDVPHTEAPYTDDDWPFDPYQFNVDVVISGEVFHLNLGGNNIEKEDCFTDAEIRYYRVGNLEVVLGLADFRLVFDDYYSPREFQYFSVFKNSAGSSFDDSIILDRIPAAPYRRSYAILPDITDNDGNQIYITDKVRLIKETVTKIMESI